MDFISTVWVGFAIIALSLLAAAGVFGGAPERILAAILVVIAVASLLLNRKFPLLSIAVEGVAFAAIYTVAMRANRIYPIWLGAIELMAITAKLWRLERPGSVSQAPIFTDMAEFGLQLFIVLVGLRAAWAMRRRFGGCYPDWQA